MLWEGLNERVFENSDLDISATGKTMGALQNWNSNFWWKNFSVHRKLRTHSYNSSHILPTNRILKPYKILKKFGTKYCQLTAQFYLWKRYDRLLSKRSPTHPGQLLVDISNFNMRNYRYFQICWVDLMIIRNPVHFISLIIISIIFRKMNKHSFIHSDVTWKTAFSPSDFDLFIF